MSTDHTTIFGAARVLLIFNIMSLRKWLVPVQKPDDLSSETSRTDLVSKCGIYGTCVSKRMIAIGFRLGGLGYGLG